MQHKQAQCWCAVVTHWMLLKCRLGHDKGRSVSAWGYWGDILNSPFHSFGTSCSEPSLYQISNKQFVHTAVSVAEYNVTVRQPT